MGVRSEGREAAIQFLYQRDQGGGAGVSDLEDFYAFRGLSPSARRFCEGLVSGLLEHSAEIDIKLREHTQNYELDRLSAVDRNILRLAIHEMLFCAEIPPVVSINEAIKIGNRILLLSPRPGRVKAEVAEIKKDELGEAGTGRLEKEIHDLLFADEPAKTGEPAHV